MFPVLRALACPDGSRLLRLAAAELAATLGPGARLRLDDLTLPVMRSNARAGWIELLWSGQAPAPTTIEPLEGDCFRTAPTDIIVGIDTGIASAIFLADTLRQRNAAPRLVVLAAARFPFRPTPSRILTPGLPAHVMAAMPLLEDWHIASRLCHPNLPGCHDSDAMTLIDSWLARRTTAATLTLRIAVADAATARQWRTWALRSGQNFEILNLATGIMTRPTSELQQRC